MSELEVVINPYNSSESKNRKGLMVQGDWDERKAKFVRSNAITAIYLNSAKGWTGVDCSFFRDLPMIEEIQIISSKSEGLESLEEMPNLEELSLTTNAKCSIDFGQFPSLEKCFVDWWSGAKSIFSCKSLKHLYLYGCKMPSFDVLSELQSLVSLNLTKANIESLESVSSLERLEKLEIVDSRKASQFELLTKLKRLKWLRVEGVRELESVQFVSSLKSLEVLQMSGLGSIDSLSPLEGLTSLKAVSFAGNTVIGDGNLSVLTKLPKLGMLMFVPKKHYTHKLVKKWNWGNFDVPDVLLKAK